MKGGKLQREGGRARDEGLAVCVGGEGKGRAGEGGSFLQKAIDLSTRKKFSTWGLAGPIWEDNHSRLWLNMDRPFMQESVWQWRIGPHGSME